MRNSWLPAKGPLDRRMAYADGLNPVDMTVMPADCQVTPSATEVCRSVEPSTYQ
jgi:hypothetical protein